MNEVHIHKITVRIVSAFILITLNNNLKAYKYALSLCAIFQQEGSHLKEWIEFHKLVGVQHFYLYNNFSTDNFREILDPYIKRGEIDLFDWPIHAKPGDATWTVSAYNHALNLARGKTKWLAILDLDEFLFPVQTDSLITFLSNYESFGGVCANWVMFGTGNVKTIPTGELWIEHLLLRAPYNHAENLHIKSIIQPNKVIAIKNQHCARYKPGHFQVTANRIPFEGPFAPSVAVDKIRINHYWSGPEDIFYGIKIPRRLIDMGEPKEECIKRNNAINKVEDKVIYKYLSNLKKRLNQN